MRFFDWHKDGLADHVGIVERVEENKIYTVEGNSDDAVKKIIITLTIEAYMDLE